MAKNKPETEENNEGNEKHLTPDIAKAIDDLIYQKKAIARDMEAYNEGVAANAEKLGIKPAVLKRRISLIIKEEEKGGEVKSQENDLIFVEQYSIVKSNLENK